VTVQRFGSRGLASPLTVLTTPPTSSDRAGALGTEGDVSFQLLLRARLDREADLLAQQTGSVLGSQAFLFTAYAVAVNGHPDPAMPDLVAKSRLLIAVIPWISVVSLLLFHLTIGGGVLAFIRLRRHVVPGDDPWVGILEVGPVSRVLGVAAPLLIPLVLLVTWLVLLFR
jgi:hypothetical protein